MFGLKGFRIKNDAFLSWSLTHSPNNSISATSSNNFFMMEFIYFVLETEWCGEPTPYLLEATSTCYDVCPARHYADDLSLTCQTCLYDCYTCSDKTSCLSCNDTTDFRIMDNGTSRCDPLPGYY